MLKFRSDLKLNPPPSVNCAVAITLELEDQMMAAVTIRLGLVDVVLVVAHLVRHALEALGHHRVYSTDIVHNRPAAAEVLHLVKLAWMTA